MRQDLIRNFCIIAHIDHGKSTLADRLLEFTGSIDKREFRDQLLDNMDLERERGITIKASSVRLIYKAQDGNEYILNLVDTPGHVDFTYEVSKSLAACEGAILVVDAAQGVEAQTVANLYLALEYKLVIVPVINKIDLSHADPERVKKQIGEILRLDNADVIFASAKRNIGTEEILEQIIKKIPPPQGNKDQPLQALVFDSVFDIYKGAIIHTRIVNGAIQPNMEITMMAKKSRYQVQEVGVFKPQMKTTQRLNCGEVGFITCNVRDPNEVIIGDTITDANHPADEPLPGCHKFHPMVFSGIYPVNAKDFPALRIAMEKLKLNDASFIYEPESSGAIGMGFRCGFLGLLHMEIVQERLEREYDLNLVITTPSVVYRVTKENGEKVEIENPAKLPAANEIKVIEEPYVIASIIVPPEAIGGIMKLAEERRGTYKATEYLSPHKVKLSYLLPLSEIIVDFYDRIKSLTRGYGSLDYAFKDYQKSDLVKLDILINSEVCDALSLIIHKTKAMFKGRALVEKLKELIPRQMFEVIIQAAIGTNIITRGTVREMKKNVTSKCYGGDITRKRKLWEKQKMGKKRMKRFGRVQIPQEAFMAALKT